MKGFEFPHKRKSVFVSTKRKYKTKSLVKDIAHKMKISDDELNEVMYFLRKGDLQIDGDCYVIKGNGFTESGPIEYLTVVELDDEEEK